MLSVTSVYLAFIKPLQALNTSHHDLSPQRATVATQRPGLCGADSLGGTCCVAAQISLIPTACLQGDMVEQKASAVALSQVQVLALLLLN